MDVGHRIAGQPIGFFGCSGSREPFRASFALCQPASLWTMSLRPALPWRTPRARSQGQWRNEAGAPAAPFQVKRPETLDFLPMQITLPRIAKINPIDLGAFARDAGRIEAKNRFLA